MALVQRPIAGQRAGHADRARATDDRVIGEHVGAGGDRRDLAGVQCDRLAGGTDVNGGDETAAEAHRLRTDDRFAEHGGNGGVGYGAVERVENVPADARARFAVGGDSAVASVDCAVGRGAPVKVDEEDHGAEQEEEGESDVQVETLFPKGPMWITGINER